MHPEASGLNAYPDDRITAFVACVDQVQSLERGLFAERREGDVLINKSSHGMPWLNTGAVQEGMLRLRVVRSLDESQSTEEIRLQQQRCFVLPQDTEEQRHPFELPSLFTAEGAIDDHTREIIIQNDYRVTCSERAVFQASASFSSRMLPGPSLSNVPMLNNTLLESTLSWFDVKQVEQAVCALEVQLGAQSLRLQNLNKR